jgi:hypothetical protein
VFLDLVKGNLRGGRQWRVGDTILCRHHFGGNESILDLVGPWNFAAGVFKPAGLTGGGEGETQLELSAGMERSGMQDEAQFN